MDPIYYAPELLDGWPLMRYVLKNVFLLNMKALGKLPGLKLTLALTAWAFIGFCLWHLVRYMAKHRKAFMLKLRGSDSSQRARSVDYDDEMQLRKPEGFDLDAIAELEALPDHIRDPLAEAVIAREDAAAQPTLRTSGNTYSVRGATADSSESSSQNDRNKTRTGRTSPGSRPGSVPPRAANKGPADRAQLPPRKGIPKKKGAPGAPDSAHEDDEALQDASSARTPATAASQQKGTVRQRESAHSKLKDRREDREQDRRNLRDRILEAPKTAKEQAKELEQQRMELARMAGVGKLSDLSKLSATEFERALSRIETGSPSDLQKQDERRTHEEMLRQQELLRQERRLAIAREESLARAQYVEDDKRRIAREHQLDRERVLHDRQQAEQRRREREEEMRWRREAEDEDRRRREREGSRY